MTHDLNTLILALESLLYALVAVNATQRRSLWERATRWLVLYAAACCLWTLGQAAQARGWPTFASDEILARIGPFGMLLLAWLFLHLTRAFLRLEGVGWGWWLLGVAWISLLAVLDSRPTTLPDTRWVSILQRQEILVATLTAGWAVFMIGSGLLIVRTYHQTHQPLHRNRIIYWSLAWGVTVTGEALYLAGNWMPASVLLVVAALIAMYVIVTHSLPDVRQTLRRVVSYVIITLLTVSLYAGGLVAMQYFFQAVPGYSPLLAGALMALVLAVLFQPLLTLVQRVVNRLIAGTGYDPNQILQEYSASISNILDLELLANVMIDLISKTLKIRGGHLFVVDREDEEHAEGAYRLREVGSPAKTDPNRGMLAPTSPIAGHLYQEEHPLMQYDIDLLARFQAISSEERAWLSALAVDVYVPIHAKGEWIGMLALGPKQSGDRYFQADLVLLRTLADQTAVALENARLVEGLIRANDDLGQAYAALAEANRQLQELDKLKSAFIGVITHELRTPFANIMFSLELLQHRSREHLPPEVGEQIKQLANEVKAAKTMVDNLVTFATFLSKQGKLRTSQLDFGQVVQDSLVPLKILAEAKKIWLHVEVSEKLPALTGDRERLGDTVYHLVHNAIKFTEAGGEVWIRCQTRDHSICLEVQDTGVGVPPDKLPTLWEDFTQIADPLRRGVEGLGLGLPLVKYVVNAHGGDVFAHGKEGVGSTFGFQIPLGS